MTRDPVSADTSHDLAARVAADGVDPDRLRAVVRRRLEGPKGPGLLDRASQVDDALAGWAAVEARVALPGTSSWPDRLAALPKAPDLLARRGLPVAAGVPAVAIVGQRRATSYGREIAAWLADSVARAGVRVISGGALGIDGAAHRAAVDAGGATTVMLGCGHGVAYPRPHAIPGGLFDLVLAGAGSLVSTCLPNEQPRAHRVLARNRLVAALADVVVVVEGGPTSGALNTASHAADQGVPVLAVPGDVRAPGSAAPLLLLSEGAGPCTGPADVLAVLGVRGSDQTVTPAPEPPNPLPPSVQNLLAGAFPRAVPLDVLAAESSTPVGALLAALTRARIAGLVTDEPQGVRLRRAPAIGSSGPP